MATEEEEEEASDQESVQGCQEDNTAEEGSPEDEKG